MKARDDLRLGPPRRPMKRWTPPSAAIAETGITALKQMGVVMKAAQAKLAGKRVDGKLLRDKVRAKLA